ncbi:hypothetical protein [Phytohabitans suffuscus]|nr:hypothetical protein [Phytohabitans suffuscus]
MGNAGSYQGQRLLAAATAAFAELGDLGFRVRERDVGAWRGGEVTVASDTVTIVIQADWIDREMAVWVRVAGAQYLPIESLIPDIRGNTLRLPRNATRGALQRRLEQIVQAVKSHASELLKGSDQRGAVGSNPATPTCRTSDPHKRGPGVDVLDEV